MSKLDNLFKELVDNVNQKGNFEEILTTKVNEIIDAMPSSPKDPVSHSKEIKELSQKIDKVIKVIEENKPDIKIPDTSKKFDSLKSELVRLNKTIKDKKTDLPEITPKIDVKVNPEIKLPKKAKDAIPVRLSDGEEFYKVMDRITHAIGQVGGGNGSGSFEDTRGVVRKAVTDTDGHLQTDILTIPTVTVTTSSVDDDPKIKHAINEIFTNYGVNVSVEEKKKSLLKFGFTPGAADASTGYTIWATGADEANETYVAANTNSIDSISSSATGDTSITFTIEGHTESGGNKTFVSQTVTTNASDGQTRVALSTPLNRVTRAYNNGATAATGNIFIYENTSLTSGKPTDTAKIHLTIRAGRNQSEKASTSLSSQDYWIITGMRGSVLEKTAVTADVSLQVRENGKLFREREDVTTSQGQPGFIQFNPYQVAPANSDIRLVTVTSSASAVDVSGSITGYLAKIV